MKDRFKLHGQDKKKRKDKRNKRVFLDLIGLKTQLAIGFTIPIVFVVLVGFISVKKAEEGIIRKFEESTISSIDMASGYLDFGFELVKSEVLKYALDKELAGYSSGLYRDDAINFNSIYTKTKSNLMTSKSTNQFIESITIIPMKSSKIISSEGLDEYGFFEDWIVSEEGQKIKNDVNKVKMTGNHKVLDELLNQASDKYINSYVSISPNESACVVIDISKDAIKDRLALLNIGNRGIAGFITSDNREITIWGEDLDGKDNNDTQISEQSFFRESINGVDNTGKQYVTFQNNEYLFLYSKSLNSEGVVYSLIPMKSVTQDTRTIKIVTFALVVLACFVAAIVAAMISFNINKNIKNITSEIEKASKGDLTTVIDDFAKNEFGLLSSRINDMLSNMRNLIRKVEQNVKQVSMSSNKVSSVSQDIDNSTKNIVYAIDEIDRGVTQQAGDSQKCLGEMDSLSHKIEQINNQVNDAKYSTDAAKNFIEEVMRVMNNLIEQTVSTTKITSKVKNNIIDLKNKSEVIENFIDIIGSIAGQTNLLSLNARIEAVRAGTHGRGFAVVAEEIRKLADASADAANEIQKVVLTIKLQTDETVEAANSADVIVEKQGELVTQTIETINRMNECVEKLFVNMQQIEANVENVEIERINTLDAVQSISAISQQTATSSSVVKESTGSQIDIVENLKGAAYELNSRMMELEKELQVFKIH